MEQVSARSAKKLRLDGVGSRRRCKGCDHGDRHHPLVVLFVSAWYKCRLSAMNQIRCLTNDRYYYQRKKYNPTEKE